MLFLGTQGQILNHYEGQAISFVLVTELVNQMFHLPIHASLHKEVNRQIHLMIISYTYNPFQHQDSYPVSMSLAN